MTLTNDLTILLCETASAYERLSLHDTSARVRDAYSALRAQLWQQYQTLSHVITFEFTSADPYDTCEYLFSEVSARNVLRVYTADDVPSWHPLALIAPNGHSYNAIFRAVHDIIGHYSGRNDFTPLGEFKAYQSHAWSLNSDAARDAVATETLGQNAWLHFGPLSDIPLASRPFAQQKAALLPSSIIWRAMTMDTSLLARFRQQS